jgi:hypothetical protein
MAPGPGTERFQNAELAATAPMRFVLRWHADLVRDTDRIEADDGRTYEVLWWAEIGLREGIEVLGPGARRNRFRKPRRMSCESRPCASITTVMAWRRAGRSNQGGRPPNMSCPTQAETLIAAGLVEEVKAAKAARPSKAAK